MIKGAKIELFVYDTGGDVTKAVQLTNKLIKNDHVVAIIGPSTTGETMAMYDAAMAYAKFLSSSAVAPVVAAKGMEPYAKLP